MKTLILSDIHGNLPALEAVLKVEASYDACLFLGDAVDYGPFPKECVRFLMDEMDAGVVGNHDNAVANNVDCGCRGDLKRFSEETRAWHKTLLEEVDLKFLRTLSPLKQTHIDGETLPNFHCWGTRTLSSRSMSAARLSSTREASDSPGTEGRPVMQFCGMERSI